MINRRKSKQIAIGNIKIGGDAPISVQSMCNTDTRNVEQTLDQIGELAAAGCEIVRLAVLNKDAAAAIKDIVAKSPVPLVADIHFDYRLAIQCIENGIQALRINPGNIGKREHTIKVVEAAKSHNVPIRIGINAGSLEKEFAELDIPLEDKMIKSAMRHIEILEDLNFYDIKLSLKSSDVMTTIRAYQKAAELIEYPLHLGVTEAGTLKSGLIKSSVGLGTLLSQGIGDTIRVSLTENPVEEVEAGFGILKSLGLRQRGINFISCPTCGRTQIDLIGLAKKVEERFKNLDLPITIAVMGCPVNGPGEAKHADFGIAGAIKEGYIFKKGEIIARVPESDLINSLENIIMESYSSVK
ncbi:MAG: flavodoxin-dependent (E)-4-hydroxy-3-methylbut-2-enyl-diphosphate synthase [Candidatus Gastranaerophilales bacterium]|nr:flavodoxin-dependent (E)-4-hydroxy-3-methylbut-2-enyl-diphosphate synthase [Candidatus Gastranaerophilales bacterium]MCM1073721.1 flavodoxin-dependent (E)-4-hydroxy-3-methylbut-2-enyl-diphosphate synthase [Bacteroides sp.]